MCSWSFSFCVVPPALRKKDVVKEFSFLQFLPKWQFPNSIQQKCAKKIIAEHWNEGGNPGCFTGSVSHTHRHSFSISASFFLADKQLLQTWPGTGAQRIVLVTLIPHFTRWEYFYPCSLDYFLPVHQIFSPWLLQQSNGIWATPRPVSRAVASPWGTARALTFLGNIFFLTSIDFRSWAYQSEV